MRTAAEWTALLWDKRCRDHGHSPCRPCTVRAFEKAMDEAYSVGIQNSAIKAEEVADAAEFGGDAYDVADEIRKMLPVQS